MMAIKGNGRQENVRQADASLEKVYGKATCRIRRKGAARKKRQSKEGKGCPRIAMEWKASHYRM